MPTSASTSSRLMGIRRRKLAKYEEKPRRIEALEVEWVSEPDTDGLFNIRLEDGNHRIMRGDVPQSGDFWMTVPLGGGLLEVVVPRSEFLNKYRLVS